MNFISLSFKSHHKHSTFNKYCTWSITLSSDHLDHKTFFDQANKHGAGW